MFQEQKGFQGYKGKIFDKPFKVHSHEEHALAARAHLELLEKHLKVLRDAGYSCRVKSYHIGERDGKVSGPHLCNAFSSRKTEKTIIKFNLLSDFKQVL